MQIEYETSYADIEFTIIIDEDDVYINEVITDLGFDAEDLYFIDKKAPYKENGEINYVTLYSKMLDVGYKKFLDEWGSIDHAQSCNTGDLKYRLLRDN